MITAVGIETLHYWLDQLSEEIVASRAKLLYANGRILLLKGHWEEAAAYFTRAKERAQVEGDPNIIGLALLFLMGLYHYFGSHDLVESLAHEGLSYLGEDSPYLPHFWIVFATTLLYRNRPEEAGREWERLLSNPFVQSDEATRFNCVSYMGPHYYFPLGRFEEAINIIEEGIRYFRHNYSLGRFGHFLAYLSSVKHEMGHFEESRKLFEESVEEMKKKGDLQFLYLGYSRIAIDAFYLKDMERAYTALSEAERALSMMKSKRLWRIHSFYSAHALLAFARGDKEAFYSNARQALKVTEERNEYWETYETVCWLAPYYSLMGDVDYAERLLEDSLKKTKKLGATYGEARSHLLLFSIALDQKKVDLALRHLKEALALCLKHRYDFLFIHKERSHAIKLLPYALKEKIEVPFVSQLLCRFGEEAAGAVLPWLKDASPEIRSEAACILAEMGCRDAEKEIVHLLKDCDSSVRKSASEVLVKINSLPPRPLKVYTLGRFQVFQGEREVKEDSWRRRKAKSIFKYLLFNHSRAISRDELMDIFWQESDPKQAQDGLYQAVSCLRTALEPGIPPKKESSYLKIREGFYQPLLPENSHVDAFAFEKLISAASEAEKRGEAYQAISGYESALKLYQGDLLQEDIYEDWTNFLREKYSDMYLKALRALSAYYFARFEYDLCIEILQKLLKKDGWDEDAYLLLLKCYLANGDRPSAIRTYQRCCKTLREELEISPKKEITDLYLAIAGKGEG